METDVSHPSRSMQVFPKRQFPSGFPDQINASLSKTAIPDQAQDWSGAGLSGLLEASSDPPVSFFGELYLRSTRPLLSPEITAREVAYLQRCFAGIAMLGPIIDLGFGHG